MRLIFLFLIFLTSPLMGNQLVDIKTVAPRIHVQNCAFVPYGYDDDLYYHSLPIYLDEFVAIRLKRVEEDLNLCGLGLIVLAGYRSPSMQEWIDQTSFDCGSEAHQLDAARYRTGLGVDVALCYIDGQKLQLPSYYGENSPRAYREFPCQQAHVYHNSKLLETYMRKHGFISQPDNWWHFDYKGWDSAPLLETELM